MYNEWDLLGGSAVAVRRRLIAAALITGAVTLGGCGKIGQQKWEPKDPAAISIREDGSITEIVNEELDQSWYDASELQNMIQSEVSDYNQKNGADSVTVKKLEAENGTINLEMEYASADDYAQFNNVEFYYGSMINAQLKGYLFDASYKKVKDGVVQGAAVSGSEVIKNMADQVLIVRAPLEVEVPGDITFTSSNAEVLSSSVVNATGEQDADEEEGLVLPSNAVYKGAEASMEEKAAANRVYIIFE